MAYYVDPPQRNKEAWLEDFATAKLGSTPPVWTEIPEGMKAVVLVDNGMFTRAVIVLDEETYKQHTAPAKRPRQWFLVQLRRLVEVTPDLSYLLNQPKG